jgi:hypothetical protein
LRPAEKREKAALRKPLKIKGLRHFPATDAKTVKNSIDFEIGVMYNQFRKSNYCAQAQRATPINSVRMS